MGRDNIAVLLMAYGGPGHLDEVEPYLLDVRGGRATPPELVNEIRQRYARIGGRSPILELTRAQAGVVATVLGDGYRVYVGMRHWHPFIKETVDEVVADGHRRLVGIVMAPHYSGMSVGAYEKKLLEAVAGRLEIALVRSWADHPRFLEAVADRVAQALQGFPDQSAVQVIFTAHSLPQRIVAAGDAYPDELRASAAAVARRRGLADWHLAYQSAGATAEPWLGPDAGELITELAARGRRAFLVVPIGFVCDHVEILYDVDIKYRDLAHQLGVRLERTPSLNDDPDLAAALADVARIAARDRGWLAR
ncbi:MAG TPA: ferrochelatase [Gemmatimonadales bacterium]|jgi:ferrochelatase|nr:ferrochelatase [Gemmatimonadales bacterium]